MEANPFAAVDGAVAAVQEVLESMLSKENLVRDQILALNMNPQMEISIPTLLSHVKLAEIGATPELVVAAATRSARLRIDDAQQMVRPLRGLPRPALPFRPVEAGHPPLIFDGSEGATLSSMPGVAQQAAPLRLEDLGTTTGQPPEDGRGKGKSWPSPITDDDEDQEVLPDSDPCRSSVPERIEVTSGDNVLLAVDATVIWRMTNLRRAAQGCTGNDVDSITELENDVLKQAQASLSAFIGATSYSDPLREPAASPLFDTPWMRFYVEHANSVLRAYGVTILSINVIAAVPVGMQQTTPLREILMRQRGVTYARTSTYDRWPLTRSRSPSLLSISPLSTISTIPTRSRSRSPSRSRPRLRPMSKRMLAKTSGAAGSGRRASQAGLTALGSSESWCDT